MNLSDKIGIYPSMNSLAIHELSKDTFLMKTFHLNMSKLNSAYETVKKKLDNFDCHLNIRISLIQTEINKQIVKLLEEIENLNNLLIKDLEVVQSQLKTDKNEFDKNLREIQSFLKSLNSSCDVDESLKKMKEYQKMMDNIPNSLNQNLNSLTFVPANLNNLNYKNSIGSVKNVSPIERFQFNFSVNYQTISKPLYSLTEFNKNLLLLELNCSYFHVINCKTFNYEEKIAVFDHNANEVVIRSICVLTHKSQICLIDNTSTCVFLLNENYELVKQVKFGDDIDNDRSFESIEYNSENKCVYLFDTSENIFYVFDDELNLIDETKIKQPYHNSCSLPFQIQSNKIYLNDLLNKCYHVFDEKINYISTIFTNETFEYPKLILNDSKNYSNYLLVFDLYDKSVNVYDSVNYQFIKSIQLFGLATINNATIINDIIVILTDHELQIFDII